MAGNWRSGPRPGIGRPEKPFADALRMEISEAGTDHKRLRRIAKALLRKAESGDMHAIAVLADRLDGKAIQQTLNENINHNFVIAPSKASKEEWEAICEANRNRPAPTLAEIEASTKPKPIAAKPTKPNPGKALN
jgi:hypothetical protein